MTLSAFQIVPIVKTALAEDLSQGDVTTDPIFPLIFRHGLDNSVKTTMVARQDCVVSGLMVAQLVFQLVDGTVVFQPQVLDGQFVKAGTVIATVSGGIAGILKGERTALNFVQHLCGIATLTRQFVEAVEGTGAKIVHTRKTTPGLRILEQQAVLDGGGHTHRLSLGQAAMLKDNHLALLGENLLQGVAAIRRQLAHTNGLEIECDDMAGVERALELQADVILLDNFSVEDLKQAVLTIHGRGVVEASGGITLDTVAAVAATGVDVISTSQITLGAPAVDIGLDMVVNPSGTIAPERQSV